jgi:hypothetical protein
MKKSLTAFACLGWILAASSVLAQDPGPKPAIRIRLSHPDEQLREVLGLFKEAKAPNPASALAAWKRASKEPKRLGKPLEALIAAINPLMIDELKTLDGAEVSIRFDPETGEPDWSAILPNDDGTFAALATAMALSDGAAEAPMGDVAVDRLAGPGSPLMAKIARGTLLARNREGLKVAKNRLEKPRDPIQDLRLSDGEVAISIEPGSLKGSKSLTTRRLEELIRPSIANPVGLLGSVTVNASVTLDSLLVSTAYFAERPPQQAAIDPGWLDWIPADRAMVGFAFATDPAAKSWDGLFGLADRLEKLDPVRADVASVQIRLDLMARLAGIRAEADVLRHLKGVSGWVGSDGKVIDGGLLVLHLDDQAAAERIVANVKPIPGSGPIPAPEVVGARSLGSVDGRAIRVSRIERSVVLTWGERVLEASLLARHNLDRSAGPRLRRSFLPGLDTLSAGGLWPGRIPGVWPEGSPLARAMIEAPPVCWQGGWHGGPLFELFLQWDDLKATVKRFLDLIPLDPPPDH